MFVALVLVCGLSQSMSTPEGCSLKSYKTPFRSKIDCETTLWAIEGNILGRLPKGAYVASTGCQTLGTSS